LGGFTFARYMTDDTAFNNDYYTRPDFKPFPAMVKEPTEYDKEVYEQLLAKNYGQFKEKKKSTLYRLLWPNHADFTPRTNRFASRENFENYNYETGAFPTYNHSYQDHLA